MRHPKRSSSSPPPFSTRPPLETALKGWAKRWALGCVNSPPWPVGGITQPRSHLFDHPCKESCQQWKVAKGYTGMIIKDLEDQMINCPEKCLTTSTYARSSQVENCGHCYFKFPHHYCQYWVYDTYNCTKQCGADNCNDCAGECNISGRGKVGNSESVDSYSMGRLNSSLDSNRLKSAIYT